MSADFVWTDAQKGNNQGTQSWLNANKSGDSVVAACGTQAVRCYILDDPKLLSEPSDADQKYQVEIGFTSNADASLLNCMHESAVAEAQKSGWFGKKKLSAEDIRERIKHPLWLGTRGQEEGVIGSSRVKMVTETSRQSGTVDVYVVTKDENGEEAWRKGTVDDLVCGAPCVADVRWLGVNITPIAASFMSRVMKIMVWKTEAGSELPCGIQLPEAKRARVAEPAEPPAVVLRGEEL